MAERNGRTGIARVWQWLRKRLSFLAGARFMGHGLQAFDRLRMRPGMVAFASTTAGSAGGSGPNGQDEQEVEGASQRPGAHETRDVDLRVVIVFAVSLLLLMVIVLVGLNQLMDFFNAEQARQGTPSVPTVEEQVPPEPRLLVNSGTAMEAQLKEENALLSEYRWVDKEQGIVQIPIDRAMELLVEQGLPARDVPVPSFGLDPAYEMESEGGEESARTLTQNGAEPQKETNEQRP